LYREDVNELRVDLKKTIKEKHILCEIEEEAIFKVIDEIFKEYMK